MSQGRAVYHLGMAATRVLVIGGGVAGCAAAVAAVAAGAAVRLLEPRSRLGGEARVGLHRTICGLAPIDAPQPTLLEPEACSAWVEAMAAGDPHRLGRVWVWPTSAERLAAALAGRCAGAGVEVVADAAMGWRIEDGRIAEIAGASGRWAADQIIDASGGDLLARWMGVRPRSAVAWPAWRGSIAAALPDTLAGRTRAMRTVQAATRVAVIALTAEGPGRWQISLDLPPGTGTAAAAALGQVAATALGGTLLAAGDGVAERDGGGWPAACSLAELFAAGERGLAWAAWPMELHLPERTEFRWPPGDRHGIPPRCIRPIGAPANLLAIGRGMPVDHEAIAALRVIGTQLALGHAAGRIAAAG